MTQLKPNTNTNRENFDDEVLYDVFLSNVSVRIKMINVSIENEIVITYPCSKLPPWPERRHSYTLLDRLCHSTGCTLWLKSWDRVSFSDKNYWIKYNGTGYHTERKFLEFSWNN